MAEPFRYLLRVRYGECDAQMIVYNARWGDYVDIATTEFTRAVFGTVDPSAGLDWRLVRQETSWRAPARFDDVLEARIRTLAIGTTSFTLRCEFFRYPDGAPLVTSETVYVAVDARGDKLAVPDQHRRSLEEGATGRVVDHAAALIR